MSLLSLEQKLEIIERSQSLGELPLDAMPYTQSDEYYFVSYSHLDYKQVYSDILRLQAAGLNVWYDRGLPAGKNWEEMAEEALTKYACVGVIFYISENSLLSDAVQNEIAFVKRLGKDFLSINMPISTGDSEKVCSAEEMLDILGASRNISEGKRAEVLSAFNSKVIYLGYNESTEVKAEKIRLLKRPDLFEYEITEKEYEVFRDFKAGVLTLKSVNSIEIKHAKVPRTVVFQGEERVVSKIGDCAFANCKNLKTVTLPDGIDIGKSAFFGCTSLETVAAERLGDIEENAFGRCSALPELPMLDGDIRTNAFFGCKNLESVTLGNSFYSESEGIFAGSGIKLVTREEQEESYSYIRSNRFDCLCDYLISFDTGSLVRTNEGGALLFGRPDMAGFFKTPRSAEKILCGFLAEGEALKKISVGAAVKDIGRLAFARCKNLECVEFEPSDTGTLEIGERAFLKTASLKEIRLPKRTNRIGAGAFERSGLRSVEFDADSELSYIGEAAFNLCSDLRRVELPSLLTKIGKSAFEKCERLDKISLPDKLKIIEDKAFFGCKDISSIEFGSEIEAIGNNAFSDCIKIKSVSLPCGLKRIGNEAFSGCEALERAELPEGLLEIGYGAFRGTAIKEITLPKSLTALSVSAIDKIEKISYLGTVKEFRELVDKGYGKLDGTVLCMDGAYNRDGIGELSADGLRFEMNGDGLGYTLIGTDEYKSRHLTVPKSYNGLPVTDISDRAINHRLTGIAFEGDVRFSKELFTVCYCLETVDFTNITELEKDTLSNRSSLKRVVLGTTLKEIPDGCFSGCRGLESVYISGNIKTVGKAAFSFCEALSEVYIESGVEEIGEMAFFMCESLREIFIPSSVTKLGWERGRVFCCCPPELIINCEADVRPAGWCESWNEKLASEPDLKPEKYHANWGKKR